MWQGTATDADADVGHEFKGHGAWCMGQVLIDASLALAINETKRESSRNE